MQSLRDEMQEVRKSVEVAPPKIRDDTKALLNGNALPKNDKTVPQSIGKISKSDDCITISVSSVNSIKLPKLEESEKRRVSREV